MSICLAKYDQTFPEHYSKRMFRANRQGPESYLHVLEGIEKGIRHLHRLGIIHDINPSHIMLKGNVPVIIDFGYCQREGESLGALAVRMNGLMRRFNHLFVRMTLMHWKQSGYGWPTIRRLFNLMNSRQIF